MGLKLGPQLLKQGSKVLSEGGGVLPLSVWPWEQAMLSALLSASHLVLSPNGGLFPAFLRAPKEPKGSHGLLVLVLSQEEAWGLGHKAHEQQHESGGHTAQHGQPAPL